MREPLSAELLELYLSGQCSPEQAAQVENWYHSFEDDADHVSSLQPADAEELKERIYHKIIEQPAFAQASASANEEEIALVPKRRSRVLLWSSISVAAVLLIAGSFVFYSNYRLQRLQSLTPGLNQLVDIANNTNQIYKVMLPDSSSVWLNPRSTIRFPKAFAAASRQVSMSGECFFEVTRNPARPFIITSRSIVTKVWGTSFLVRDDEESKTADVSVMTGKVSVSIKDKDKTEASAKLGKDEVMLYPNQSIVCVVDEHQLKPEAVAEEPEMHTWTRVNLSFDNRPLRDIIPVLDSKFHVNIVTADENINRYMLKADMTGFNLPDVLEALKKSLNIDYEIRNNSIELYKPVN